MVLYVVQDDFEFGFQMTNSSQDIERRRMRDVEIIHAYVITKSMSVSYAFLTLSN